MNKKTIDQLELKGKTVLIKVDFNVPMVNGKITSDKRIVEALPTIKKALKDKAKVVVFSHLGRVESLEDKKNKDSSLKSVAKYLGEKLKKEVIFVAATRGKKLEDAIKALKPGQILMFENVRFEDVDKDGNLVKLESKNNADLGKYWASLGDVFINDAFGAAHRAAASNVGIAANIKESAVGYLMEKELRMLAEGIDKPKTPFVAIIGGAKVSDKIGVIENLLTKANKIIIGGAMAYTFLAANGVKVGASRVEKESLDFAKKMLKEAGNKIVLPVDHAVVKNTGDFKADLKQKKIITKGIDIEDGFMALDLGPKSIALYEKTLKGAKTVAWNGPMGVFEVKEFAAGTEAVAKAITKLPGVFSLIGGGDSAKAAEDLGFAKKFTHISTGGGASLEYMEGKTLPGVACVQDASLADKAKTVAKKAATSTKKATKKAVKVTKPAVKKAAAKTKEATVKAAKATKKATVKAATTVKAKAEAKKAPAKKPAAKKPAAKKTTKK